MTGASAAEPEVVPPTTDVTTRIAAGSNAFGLDLYSHLRSTSGNMALSPASISLAVAMTWGGAKGETAAPFFTSQSQKKDVPTMHRTGNFSFAQRDRVRVLAMPYKGEGMSMLVVLPDDVESLSAVEASLGPEGLGDLVAMMRAQAMPAKAVELKADHPFLFFLRDEASGLILFMGRVAEP